MFDYFPTANCFIENSRAHSFSFYLEVRTEIMHPQNYLRTESVSFLLSLLFLFDIWVAAGAPGRSTLPADVYSHCSSFELVEQRTPVALKSLLSSSQCLLSIIGSTTLFRSCFWIRFANIFTHGHSASVHPFSFARRVCFFVAPWQFCSGSRAELTRTMTFAPDEFRTGVGTCMESVSGSVSCYGANPRSTCLKVTEKAKTAR